jgi:small subunit ribosomal protein S3
MGQKVNPVGFRIGVNKTWSSRWFGSGKNFSKRLEEDVRVREFILKQWKSASVADVAIERSRNFMRIIVRTSRPGVIIGRGGSGVEDMIQKIKKRFFPGSKDEIKMDIQEIRNFEESASLLAQNVAEQLEKRTPFRRALKSALDQAEKNREIKGVKIAIAGRLGGAEMSRDEWLSRGSIPLHTLRANIDYAGANAYTTYGVIGVKVWIYKGEVIEDRNEGKGEELEKVEE